jgi:hypothetical protein
MRAINDGRPAPIRPKSRVTVGRTTGLTYAQGRAPYKRHRLAAGLRGEGFMSFKVAETRLRQALIPYLSATSLMSRWRAMSPFGNFGPSAMSQLSPLSAPERTWIILKIVDVGCP